MLQNALKCGHEARIVQIDVSASFNRVNHQRILYKLFCVGIGCSVLSILTQLLSNRPQRVIVDRCRSKLVNVVAAGRRVVFCARYCSSCSPRAFFQAGE